MLKEMLLIMLKLNKLLSLNLEHVPLCRYIIIIITIIIIIIIIIIINALFKLKKPISDFNIKNTGINGEVLQRPHQNHSTACI